MRVVVQRVTDSSVTFDNVTNTISKGLTLLVGFTHDDTMEDIDYMVRKIVNLRIFDDENGVMNKSVLDVKGEILSISQFTLYANTKKGNRPSYIEAMDGSKASKLYDIFNEKLSEFCHVETGMFGAEMLVSINNDGPITIILESRK